MGTVFANVGNSYNLKVMLGINSYANPVLHLFSNNYTPTTTDTVSNYTEVSATGYSSQSLSPGNWTVSLISGVEVASYITLSFTLGSSATIYGYYLTDSTNTVLVGAEQFSGSPYVYPSIGGTLNISLQIGLS